MASSSESSLDRSLQWLRQWEVDEGAKRIFLQLSSEAQESIRRQGGLKSKSESSRILMARIRTSHGWIHAPVEQTEQKRCRTVQEGTTPKAPQPQPPEAAPTPEGPPREPSRYSRPSEKPFKPPASSGFKPFKGEGRGSLGDPVPLPSREPASRPFKGGGRGSADDAVPAPEPVATYPTPIRYTPEEVERMLNGEYFKQPRRAFWKDGDLWSIKAGDHVLWMGLKKGKRGGQSTNKEYFNGIFHRWDGDRAVLS